MTPRDRSPLDDGERELAQRLARMAPGTGPSPALDAKVLALAAAAHGTQASPPVRAHPSPRRWSLGLGMAASVVLAAGLALQMKPPHPAAEGYAAPSPPASAASPEAATVAPPSGAEADAAFVESANPATVAHARPPARQPQADAATDAASRDVQSRREASLQSAAKSVVTPSDGAGADAPAAPAARERGVLGDTAAPARAATAVAPPPPPAAPPTPWPAASDAAAAQRSVSAPASAASPTSESKPAARTQAGGAASNGAPAPESTPRPVNPALAGEESFDEAPPASADSPAVRRAWLARIRELVLDGEDEAARASLQEFRRRYPAAAVPEDLRDLLP